MKVFILIQLIGFLITYIVLHRPKAECSECGQLKKEHGWNDQKDCLNSECEKFYYRDFGKLEDSHRD